MLLQIHTNSKNMMNSQGRSNRFEQSGSTPLAPDSSASPGPGGYPNQQLCMDDIGQHSIPEVGEDFPLQSDDIPVKDSEPLVLLIDDDAMNYYAVRSQLRNHNVQSDYAPTGQFALELIEKRLMAFRAKGTPIYKVIMVDYSMPQMDGP